MSGVTFLQTNAGDIRKVVVETPSQPAVPGGFNSAAGLISFQCLTGPLASNLTNAEITQALVSCETIEDQKSIKLIFDCDTGLFDCQDLCSHTWDPVKQSKQFYHNGILGVLVRSMVEGEKSIFICRNVADKLLAVVIECHKLYARERLQPPHAVTIIKDWPSYDLDQDERRYLHWCGEDKVHTRYADRCFLYVRISCRQDVRSAGLLGLVTFQCRVNQKEVDETVTIGMGDINPWLEVALMTLSPKVESFLLLPREAKCDNLVSYARPAVWSDPASAWEDLARSSRYFGASLSTVQPGAFGVLPSSKLMKDFAQVSHDLEFDDLIITDVQLLPDLRSDIYHSQLEPATADEELSSESVSEMADEFEEEIDDIDTREFNNPRSAPGKLSAEERLNARAGFVESVKRLGVSLVKSRCYFDALRLFNYGLINVEVLNGNKSWERERDDAICDLRRRLERNICIVLYHLKEHRHGIFISNRYLAERDSDDVSMRLWAARHEAALDRYEKANAHLMCALQNVKRSSPEEQLIRTELNKIRKILSAHQLELKIQNLNLYKDRYEDDDFLAHLGIEIRPIKQ